MKNSMRHPVLVLAGLACVFMLCSCALQSQQKTKVDEQKSAQKKSDISQIGPRCTRDVTRILPGPTQCLQDIHFVGDECILETDVLEAKSGEDEFLRYQLNLEDLTVRPYQNSILEKNQKLEFLMDFEKVPMFLVSNNKHFSILLKNSGKTVKISLPIENKDILYHSRIHFDQNRLYFYSDGRLLRWIIANGQAQPLPEMKTSFGFDSGSCCFPWIENVEGEKLWLYNDSGAVISFDLKTRKTAEIKKGDYSKMHDPHFLYKSGHTWTWAISKNNSGHSLDTLLFDLVCRKKGQIVATYEIVGIQSLFFDENDVPMVWTKGGSILKLVDGKWVQLIASPEFSNKTQTWTNESVLEDGRICLIWRYDGDPRDNGADPVLRIIDINKNEFEVMRFPFQLK